MMCRGLLVLPTLLLIGLCLASASNIDSQLRRRTNDQQDRQDQQLNGQPGNGKPFRGGYEYSFTYNGQITTGLNQPLESVGGASNAQQKSATRIQCQAKIAFRSSRHATLRLEQIRVGYLNERIQDPQQVQPMGMFEPKQIQDDKRRELQLPCEFSYVDGVVERIEFHTEDSKWSKNIKRAVLNLIQLNLSKNNAQGLRAGEELGEGQQQEQQQLAGNALEQGQQQQQQKQQNAFKTNTFTLPETTIEGECQTTYTINKAQSQRQQKQQGRRDSSSSSSQESRENKQQNSQEDQVDQDDQYSTSCPNCFNVTKSINFKQCKKIADVAYGFQTEQIQPQCAQCQQQWAKQQQQQQGQQQHQQQPHPCDQCDPKEIKEQKLDRTTVQRFVLNGKPEKYSIKRAELISQYVYKNLRSETGQYGAAMQAIVACELVFQGVQQKSTQQQQQQSQQQQHQMKPSSERDESLLYSNQWDVDEKRFYMYGDEEYQRRDSPFGKVPNKVEQAQTLILRLISSASDKNAGIEADNVVILQRLVELLRMCSVAELKDIQQLRAGGQQQQGQQSGFSRNNDPEQQKVQQILADTLAIAGTRNTIHVLVEKILNQQVSTAKAVQTLKALSGLPAPSDSQVDEILRLCKNEIVHRNQALKQSCWLTFGSMVGELCQHKTQKNAQQAFSVQSGFNKDEICALHKKQIYKKVLFEQYKEADTTYEQVLALKSLGNAGIDIAVQELEQIIRDKRMNRIVRIQAIDALRRLRTQMPKKIQRVLLPVFQNTREHPEVRMAAFSMIMHTQPEQQIVDQCAFTLTKEPSKQVQSFVYTLMKSLAQSHVPIKQQLAKHLKNALKLTNVDEQTLRSSRKYQVPIYSHEEKEGMFLNLASVFSTRSMLPSHLSASVDSMLNDEFEMNTVKVSFTQKDIDNWYEKLVQSLQQNSNGQYSTSGSNGQPTRAQRSNTQSQRQSGEDELRGIFSKLGIKSRQSQFSYEIQGRNQNQQGQKRQDNSPFAMICVRIGDVDQVILPIDQQNAPAFLQQMLDGQKPSLRSIMDTLNGKPFRFLTALNLNEKSAKFPTSMGVPLRILSAVPVLANIEGHVRINGQDSSSSGQSASLDISLHPSITAAHIQKMDTWLPIVVTGVESVRAIEINAPIRAQIQLPGGRGAEGIQINLKMPQVTKTRVFGLHTVPVTFIREFNSEGMLKDPRVKTIHNEQLEQLERNVNKVLGQHSYGTPFQVKGHYHHPSSASDYKQVVQLLMATENHLHVTFEPTEDSPKEIQLLLSGGVFQKIEGSGNQNGNDNQSQNGRNGRSHQQLKSFYSNTVKFEHAYPEDFSDMQLEDHTVRREKLNSFLDKFQPSQMYKHQLKLSAKCVGGRKECEAKVELEANCDAKFKYCKVFADVERSPMYADENGKWTLKSEIQVLRPQSVSSVQQLEQLAEKNQKFVCMAETQWGMKEKKQMVNLRIQGENAKKPQWHQQEQEEQDRQQQNKYYKKRTPFLNKFDVVADYKLQPSMQNLARRCFDALKIQVGSNYWNTQTEDRQDQQQQLQQNEGRNSGKLYATVVIDPISQKHANISVKTATQAVRIQSVELPTQIRPFPLVRKSDKQSHSVSHLFFQSMSNGRAECRVDGQKVDTFDGVLYKSPISKRCYSVLAKDCSSESPKFVVLMKAQQQQQQQQTDSQEEQDSQNNKKIKVITPEHTIECQPKQNGQQEKQQQQRRSRQQRQKLECKINGRIVKSQRDESNQQQEQSNEQQNGVVEYDNEEQTQCTINVHGVQVRFNGKKAWIKISNLYKNSQCGLCGHYNDESDDEWRNAKGEHTKDLAQFHRSFSLQDGEECTEQEQNSFYQQHGQKFQAESQEFGRNARNGIWREDREDNGYGSRTNSEESSDEDEQQDGHSSWWGQQKKQQSRRGGQQQRKWNSQQDQEDEQNTEAPVMKTKIIEYNHKICFSTQPVKMCPEGTAPTSNYRNNASGEQQQKKQTITKMAFTCLDRSSVDARRLQRQARRGVVVELGAENVPSFREDVKQPTRCVRY